MDAFDVWGQSTYPASISALVRHYTRKSFLVITVRIPDHLLEKIAPVDASPDVPEIHRYLNQHQENVKAKNRAANRVARRSRKGNRQRSR